MALDPFDYEEPACLLCDNKQSGIPVRQIIEKIDDALNREDYPSALHILEYWRNEAQTLGDLRGELAVQSELMGLHRKSSNEAQAISAAERGIEIIDLLGIGSLVSSATILINAATVFKTFNRAQRAVKLFERAEKIYSESLDENDALFGALYNNMGLALADLEKTESAKECFEKAISVMSKVDGGCLEQAITCLNLADLCFGDDAQTERLVNEAYRLLSLPGTPQNTYCAFVYKKCAPAFSAHGFFLIAKEIEERADRIYEGA